MVPQSGFELDTNLDRCYFGAPDCPLNSGIAPMVRKGKLDLMNCRLAGPPQAAAVFDSSLDNALPNTMSTLSTSNYDFDKTLRRDQQRNPEIYHSNEIVDPSTHTYDGDEVTFKQRVLNSPVKSYVKERRSNHFEHLYNETAEIYRVARKIDTTISTKKNTAGEKSIAARVQRSEVPGVQFSKCVTHRPPLNTIPTQLGPGHYDVNAWESGRCGISQKALKFSSASSHRNEIFITGGPSATTYFCGDDGEGQTINRRPATTGSVQFNKATRFQERSPDYLKGTGLLLSHDFDSKSAWKARGSYDLATQSLPRCDTAPVHSEVGVDFVNTDAGTKITFKTEVAKSKYQYAPCFKSKSRVGLAIPTPTSGDIGPDHYRGVYQSSLKCTDPDNKSSSFAAKRHIDITQLGAQYNTLKPRFGKICNEVEHTRQQTMNATYGEKMLPEGRHTTFGRGRKGKLKKSMFSNKLEFDFTPEVKLSHIAEFSKTKITKIYPRLAKEKYGEVLEVGESGIA